MIFKTLASSSDGNAVFVREASTALLIDAGISLRRLTAGLQAMDTEFSALSGILITHEHVDHVRALPMIIKKHPIPIYAPRLVAVALGASIPGIGNYLRTFEPGAGFLLGDFAVRSFLTHHDTAQSVGYRLTAGERSLSLVTDTGHVSPELLKAVLGSDAVILEANYDPDMLANGPYPYPLKRRIRSDRGHLSNEDSGAFAAELVKAGTKQLLLAHLSEKNNTPGCALRTVSAALAAAGVMPERLEAAPAREAGDCFTLQ